MTMLRYLALFLFSFCSPSSASGNGFDDELARTLAGYVWYDGREAVVSNSLAFSWNGEQSKMNSRAVEIYADFARREMPEAYAEARTAIAIGAVGDVVIPLAFFSELAEMFVIGDHPAGHWPGAFS